MILSKPNISFAIHNHKYKYSNGFPMVKKGKIDIKFLFVSHLAQKLWPNPFQVVAILDLAAILAPRVAGSGALAKLFQYNLSYICAKFGAFRWICAKWPIYVLKAPN